MSTWLVTGATGFLGRHLLRVLVQRGDRVRALVRTPPSEALPSGVELAYGDVLAAETLPAAMVGIDGVFHLAGRVIREGDRDQLFALHVDGTANVLRAMAEEKVPRIVLASTLGTVAVSVEPAVFDDSAPYADAITAPWPYYQSKVHAEVVAKRMAARLGIEIVVLRPSLLLGPEDLGHSSTDDVRRYIQGDYPIVPKGGVSFLDVRDCAATFAKAMDRARSGESYLLGGANMTLRDFFVLVANVADVEPPVAELSKRYWRVGAEILQAAASIGWIERPERASVEMSAHFWYCDWSRACAEIGHSPRSPVETVEDTVAWLQSWGEITAAEPGKLLRLPFRTR